ncbi:hypothetical protein K1W54_15465 [Micromonospora sp. CPCC 205371]|nr:hypothetical protein [Micromonospora sp. CPCC 205371]
MSDDHSPQQRFTDQQPSMAGPSGVSYQVVPVLPREPVGLSATGTRGQRGRLLMAELERQRRRLVSGR